MSSPDALQRDADPTDQVSYRWRCPYCGASWTSWGDDEDIVRRRAHIAVQNHTYATAERGHGPYNTVPEDFHPAVQYLERITG